jgi:hypothetical protein
MFLKNTARNIYNVILTNCWYMGYLRLQYRSAGITTMDTVPVVCGHKFSLPIDYFLRTFVWINRVV